MDKLNFQAAFWTKRSLYDNVLFYYSLFPVTIWPILCIIDAPYGKFAGKLIIDLQMNGKLGWFLMEVTSPILFVTSILPPVYQTFTSLEPVWTTTQSILTVMWLTHYINRSTIYPLRAHSISPMNILTFLSSLAFNGANAYTNGMWVAKYGSYPDSLLQKPRFWFGVALWGLGWWLNIYHDNILFKLRQERQVKDSKKRYSIPHGGLYEYVSCPNYFSETLEWIGWAVACYPSPPANIFVLSTIANLFPRAWRSHKWYKQEFSNYPPNRKAVVPFLF
ncbi:hypothetical protein Unana1_06554 [Umbelopsis nana]